MNHDTFRTANENGTSARDLFRGIVTVRIERMLPKQDSKNRLFNGNTIHNGLKKNDFQTFF
jgi:hypothetical protein